MESPHDYLALGEHLHDLFLTIVSREELDIQEGLDLLTCYVFNEFRSIHAMLLKEQVPHADGRLWQAMARITHQLAHAPHGMPLEVDAWLHPDLADEYEHHSGNGHN